MSELHVTEAPAPFGLLSVAAGAGGVVGVHFGPAAELVAQLRTELAPFEVVVDGPLVDHARAQLVDYLEGRRDRFDVALDWQRVPGFRGEVLRALVEVPCGRTVSYGELAEAVGKPGAGRAVGTAMARNPFAVLVPCHRVVRKDSAIGGFAGARNALDIKRWLLAREGVVLV